MTDDIRALSEELAIDPSSAAFVRLGELLRQRGDLDFAYRVATRGLQRHPQRVDAHDLVARLALDRGDDARARSEWELVLALSPGHAGAHKGLGFLAFRQGDGESAARHLTAAMTADPQDASLAVALETVRAKAPPLAARATPPANRVITPPAGQMVMPAPPFAPRPAAAAELFDAALGDGAEMTLLLDHDGYVIAGGHHGGAGEGRGADIGARLSGVSDEADRTTRHLGLGRWHQIVFETRAAGVAMAPAGDGVLLVAAPPAVPLGLLRRMLERSLQRARRWLESGT